MQAFITYVWHSLIINSAYLQAGWSNTKHYMQFWCKDLSHTKNVKISPVVTVACRILLTLTHNNYLNTVIFLYQLHHFDLSKFYGIVVCKTCLYGGKNKDVIKDPFSLSL